MRTEGCEDTMRGRLSALKDHSFMLVTSAIIGAASLLLTCTHRSEQPLIRLPQPEIPAPSTLTHDPETKLVLHNLELAFNIRSQPALRQYLTAVAEHREKYIRQASGDVYTYYLSYPRESNRNPAFLRMVLNTDYPSSSTNAAIDFTFDRDFNLGGSDTRAQFDEGELRAGYPKVVSELLYMGAPFTFSIQQDPARLGMLSSHATFVHIPTAADDLVINPELHADGTGRTILHTQIHRP